MDTQQTLGNFGARYSLHWKGKLYQFSFIGDRQKAWYEKQVKQAIYLELENDEFSTEEQKAQDRMRLRSSIAGGDYKWGGRKWDEFRRTQLGSFYMFWMMLALDYPELKESDLRQMADDLPIEVAAITALVAADSFIESSKATPQNKQIAMEKVYTQLMKPPDAGGIGLTIEVLSQLTDRQKQEIIVPMGDKEETRPQTTEAKTVEITPESKAQVEKMLRDYASTISSST